jgi:hypothetical protein
MNIIQQNQYIFLEFMRKEYSYSLRNSLYYFFGIGQNNSVYCCIFTEIGKFYPVRLLDIPYVANLKDYSISKEYKLTKFDKHSKALQIVSNLKETSERVSPMNELLKTYVQNKEVNSLSSTYNTEIHEKVHRFLRKFARNIILFGDISSLYANMYFINLNFSDKEYLVLFQSETCLYPLIIERSVVDSFEDLPKDMTWYLSKFKYQNSLDSNLLEQLAWQG